MDNKSFVIGLVIGAFGYAYDEFLDDVFGRLLDRLHKKRLEKRQKRGKKCK